MSRPTSREHNAFPLTNGNSVALGLDKVEYCSIQLLSALLAHSGFIDDKTVCDAVLGLAERLVDAWDHREYIDERNW